MKAKVVTHKSEIHGTGVFASDSFAPGWFIGTIGGRVLADVPSFRFHDEHLVWLEDGRGRSYALDPEVPFRFTNHSDEPNAELDGCNLYALCLISPGDEVTINYGEGWEPGDLRVVKPGEDE